MDSRFDLAHIIFRERARDECVVIAMSASPEASPRKFSPMEIRPAGRRARVSLNAVSSFGGATLKFLTGLGRFRKKRGRERRKEAIASM